MIFVKIFFSFFLFFLFPFLLFSQNWLNTTAGGTRYVECNDLDVPGTRITVEALITIVSPSVNIVSKHSNPGDLNYLLRPGGFEISTTNGYYNVVNTFPLLDNTVYHVAGVYDGSNMYYYVNGCLTGTLPATGNMLQNDWEMSIGNQEDCQCEQFVGYIDEVRIWNVARTSAELQANMNFLPSPGTQTGLLAYYQFEGNYVNAQGNASWNGSGIGGPTTSLNPFFTSPLVPLTASISSSTNVSCYGGSNGSITASATGSTAPYTYSIDGINFQASPTFSGLAAGSYTITVRSSTGCEALTGTNISQPNAPVSFTLTNLTNASCADSANGSISVAVLNGTAPYNYSWSNGQTTNPATGLAANTYTVTVTDANGCTGDTSFIITQPQPLSVSIFASTPANCFGASDGTANASALGGSSPYSYLWDNGETGDFAQQLNAGNHVITVTDVNGCTATDNVNITQPAQFSANITAQTDAVCFGGNTGTATVAPSGGNAPYLYLWSNGQTNATATGLAANTYSVTLSDMTGCTASTTVTIGQPPQLTAVISTYTDVTCNGNSDGTANATATGGTPSYSFLWGNGQNTANATGLSAGAQTVTVTDAAGCTATGSVMITQPAAVTASIFSFTHVSCFGGNNGSATVAAAGGTNTFSYQWSNGQNSATANNLAAGNYSVTVTDGNGCSVTVDHTVTEPTLLTATIVSSTNVSCFGGSNGSATVQAMGGFAPYAYSWSSGGNQATDNNLVAGLNTVSVIDINGCIANASVSLTQPPQLILAASQPATICLGSNTTIFANAMGGIEPYTFTWNNGFIGNSQVVSPNSNTQYYVHVTDANGCMVGPDTVRVFVRPPLTISGPDYFEICKNESATFQVNGAGGDSNFSYQWNQGLGTSPGIHTVTPDTTTVYTVTLTDGCGTPPAIHNITVKVNPLPVALFNAEDTTGCVPLPVQFYNLTTIESGSIAQYFWTFGNGETSNLVNPLSVYSIPGTYDVSLIAVSNKGCRDTFDISSYIISYPVPVAAFSIDPDITPIISPEVKFTDLSVGATIWQWTFGDGDSSDVSSPLHTYQDTGTFYVYLRVENDYGCFSSAFNRVIVNPFPTIWIPSAFTPDADGINDTWAPKGSDLYEYELKIYNRWGSLMFYTNDPMQGWDGLTPRTALKAKQDMYVYTIFFRDERGKQNRINGYFSLIR